MRRNIHLMGIGGVGMASLAVLLKGMGFRVTGCDKYRSKRTAWLEKLGIDVFESHSPEHIAATGCDELVITNAIDRGNPEVSAAPRCHLRGEVLAGIVSSRDSIAVCGSHGKTTTATFIARLLLALGENVSWAIGGETGDFPVGGFSPGGPLVVEADESDGTLALYAAKTLVVTNCEYDHPDHFATREEYFACFEEARRKAQTVIESEELRAEDYPEMKSYGLAPHNEKNARAAVEVAVRRGHSRQKIFEALERIVRQLPDRRFQCIWPEEATQEVEFGVWTDYAHHPTEMRCAIGMARDVCRGKLRVLFQPHRYSRTKALLNDFVAALAGVDELVILPVYAAFERLIEGGDSADLYRACREKGMDVKLAPTIPASWRHVYLTRKPGDVVLLLGAGDIISLLPRVIADCRSGAAAPRQGVELAGYSFFKTGGVSFGGGARRIAGAGSNLWISDLATDEEYVRTDAPAGKCGASLHIPWMAGIPGTIGGWVKMNAGAFGHSVSELIRRVKIDGVWHDREECGFGYRKSNITGVIEDVEWLPIPADDTPYLQRRKKFPPRTCGSVFKNPPGDYAGRLLESCGFKGFRVGGAFVWQEHANVIVAGDGCTSSDILALSKIMRNAVLCRFGIELRPEIAAL